MNTLLFSQVNGRLVSDKTPKDWALVKQCLKGAHFIKNRILLYVLAWFLLLSPCQKHEWIFLQYSL